MCFQCDGNLLIMKMEIGISEILHRGSVPLSRQLSDSNSSDRSNAQLHLRELPILCKHPSRRYSRSTNLNSPQKAQQARNFVSSNLCVRQKIRDRSYYAIKRQPVPGRNMQTRPQILTPLVPLKQSYARMSKELETTKDKSLFHSSDLENQTHDEELEELFYKQVRFFQRCKEKAKRAR